MQLRPWNTRLTGRIRPPSDKSITHRGVLFSALARGVSEVLDPLDSLDTGASLAVVQNLGVKLIEKTARRWVLESPGYYDLQEPRAVIDCLNSGTTMRLSTGLLAGTRFLTVLSGDESLRERPMARVMDPLRALGVDIRGRQSGKAPLVIQGGPHRGGASFLSVASAQVKSALILAGLSADDPLTIHEVLPTRDHTERLLRAMGASVEIQSDTIKVTPGPVSALTVTVPGDPSSAAYWAALAVLLEGSQLVIEDVSLNAERIGFYRLLRNMGARVEFTMSQEVPEPIGEIRIGWAPLKGVAVGADVVPGLIDELPLVALLGAHAEGTTVVSGAGELRVKETDRIRATTDNLRSLGIEIEERPDGFAVRGGQRVHRGSVKAMGDHRIAMMLAVAGAVADGPIVIEGAEAIEISYPEFFRDYWRFAGE